MHGELLIRALQRRNGKDEMGLCHGHSSNSSSTMGKHVNRLVDELMGRFKLVIKLVKQFFSFKEVIMGIIMVIIIRKHDDGL